MPLVCGLPSGGVVVIWVKEKPGTHPFADNLAAA